MSPRPMFSTFGAVCALLCIAGALAQTPAPTFAPGTQARVTVSTAVLRAQPRSL